MAQQIGLKEPERRADEDTSAHDNDGPHLQSFANKIKIKKQKKTTKRKSAYQWHGSFRQLWGIAIQDSSPP